jgi:galactokinase
MQKTMSKHTVISQSPGRINLIGEHTDYNEGLVLPATIDKNAVFQLSKNGTPNQANIKAMNVDEHFSFDLTNFSPLSSGWQNYVMGVVSELQKLGAKFSGFDGEFAGDVPIGSGMSSSAALECSLAFGLNELFDLKFDRWQLIKACQMAEHNFAGIQCGIMDQFASMMGKKNQAMLLDCRTLEFKHFPLDLGQYEILLLNSNVSHALASSEYNTRKAECEEGVAILQKLYPTSEIKTLRDVVYNMLPVHRELFSEKIYHRCKHVVLENSRVLKATTALKDNDFKALGNLIYDSHYSLQNYYEVSCSELDFLVQETIDHAYILGSRMMGGGFGGCTINIIEKSRTEEFTNKISSSYRDRFGMDTTPYRVSIKDGTRLLETK